MANSLFCSAKLNALTSAKSAPSLFYCGGNSDIGLAAAGLAVSVSHENDKTASAPFRAISLFSGLGGAEYGFQLAGIETAVSLEIDKLACASLRANYKHPVLQGDITAMVDAAPDCHGILESAGLQPGEAFVVMGGPPCQSFSRAGKRLGTADPRGLLYIPFLSVVRAARPRFVVMENAPDLAKMRLDPTDLNSPTVVEDIKNRLQEIGYQTVIHGVLDAVSYGAPQYRSRLILVASRDNENIFLPHPTHFQHHQDPDRRWRTLRNAIGDLIDPGPYRGITDHLWQYLKDVPPGGDVRDLSPEICQQYNGKGAYFRKPSGDEPCPTVVCDPGHWTNLLTHPEERRFLSVRECARIQGLPDSYVIAGDTASPQYRQVGNAWPAALGRAIGQMLVSVATDTANIRTRRKSAAKLPTASPAVAEQPVKAPKAAKKKVQETTDTRMAAANIGDGETIDIEEFIATRAAAVDADHVPPTTAVVTDTQPPHAVACPATVQEMTAPIPCSVAQMVMEVATSSVVVTEDAPVLPLVEAIAVTDRDEPVAATEALACKMGEGIAQAIRQARECAKLSMQALATAAGLTKGAVHNLELGHGRMDTVIAVSGPLGLHLEADGSPEGGNFGTQVAALRKSLGISQRGAARQSGVSTPTVAKIESGNPRVHLAGMLKLAALLGVSLTLQEVVTSPVDLVVVADLAAKKTETFTFGEFFCGAGGLSYAAAHLLQGPQRMEHRWSVDASADACHTYRQNICPDSPESVICGDIRKLDMSTLPDVDVLLFGFPCNDFSTVGEQKGLNGNFGPLYRYPVEFLRTRQPKFFVAENVSGLASANGGEAMKQIITEMADAGYRVTAHLYKLEEYGIAQSRHRIFLVGVRQDLGLNFRVPAPSGAVVTSRQALTEPPIPANAANHELPIPTPLVAERLSKIPAGANLWSVNDTLPAHLRLNVKGAKISTIYKRLDPDRPAYTLTASGGGGTHMYHWAENRALTNRERARLQTFPD
ncbi:MAG TPA: DNA (cytosine-5-)-methyltransferase, partial [Patescibacteria group bacterium]|nr:DNA (cytosine-5-)-methyltransferase [Patescibacteria group bacterium]